MFLGHRLKSLFILVSVGIFLGYLIFEQILMTLSENAISIIDIYQASMAGESIRALDAFGNMGFCFVFGLFSCLIIYAIISLFLDNGNKK